MGSELEWKVEKTRMGDAIGVLIGFARVAGKHVVPFIAPQQLPAPLTRGFERHFHLLLGDPDTVQEIKGTTMCWYQYALIPQVTPPDNPPVTSLPLHPALPLAPRTTKEADMANPIQAGV